MRSGPSEARRGYGNPEDRPQFLVPHTGHIDRESMRSRQRIEIPFREIKGWAKLCAASAAMCSLHFEPSYTNTPNCARTLYTIKKYGEQVVSSRRSKAFTRCTTIYNNGHKKAVAPTRAKAFWLSLYVIFIRRSCEQLYYPFDTGVDRLLRRRYHRREFAVPESDRYRGICRRTAEA